jgi:HlyD family secretion protein
MNKIIRRGIIGVLAISTLSCNNGKNKSDAYGNFEAIETLVGAEAQGKVVQLSAIEGSLLKENEVVGLIDTLSLYLKKQQLLAQKESATARLSQVRAQIDVQDEQKKTALKEKDRIEKLIKDNAVPTKQLDDINGQLNVLNSQITSIGTQNQSISGDIKALTYQIAQIQDQINKSVITNPISGVVLEKYIEQGEIVAPGKTIYKIANLTSLKLKVFISGSQLSHVKLGQKVKVFIDESKNKNKELEGTVCWISEQAEFTPKIIQTKEERVNLVYAVKVDVMNDGSLKIGMPGEVRF